MIATPSAHTIEKMNCRCASSQRSCRFLSFNQSPKGADMIGNRKSTPAIADEILLRIASLESGH